MSAPRYIVKKSFNKREGLYKLDNKKPKPEKIQSPKTRQYINKYGQAWWNLQLYDHYLEDQLEELKVYDVQPVHRTTVKELTKEWFHPGTRAGVILYTFKDNQLMFGFGLDKQYQQLTSFAGGYNNKDTDVVQAALRELSEETFGLYHNISIKNIENNVVLYDKFTVTLFLMVESDLDDINTNFQLLKHQHQGKIEIDDIVWITREELQLSIWQKLGHIYTRDRKFLERAGNFYDYL